MGIISSIPLKKKAQQNPYRKTWHLTFRKSFPLAIEIRRNSGKLIQTAAGTLEMNWVRFRTSKVIEVIKLRSLDLSVAT